MSQRHLCRLPHVHGLPRSVWVHVRMARLPSCTLVCVCPCVCKSLSMCLCVFKCTQTCHPRWGPFSSVLGTLVLGISVAVPPATCSLS